MEGVCKFFKGTWGFLQPATKEEGSAGGRDAFVHISQVHNGQELKAGDKVRFDMGTDERTGKPCAVNVRVLEDGVTLDKEGNK